MTESMTCNSCDQTKAKLYPRSSALLPGIRLYLCQSCIEKKYEPRWCIIMAGRTNGHEYVKDYILKERYIGNPIHFKEVIK